MLCIIYLLISLECCDSMQFACEGHCPFGTLLSRHVEFTSRGAREYLISAQRKGKKWTAASPVLLSISYYLILFVLQLFALQCDTCALRMAETPSSRAR